MKKIILIIVLLVLALLVGLGVKARSVTLNQNSQGKLQVSTSFYPLYFFASKIGGEKANVVNITPAGAEPHDYDPSTADIANIENSSLLIINGGGLEPWGDKVSNIVGSKKVDVVRVADDITTQLVDENGTKVQDPHVWLDPVLAKKMVQKILDGFIKVDPGNKVLYTKNANDIQVKLDTLDQEFRNGLKSCSQKDIVTSHAAFGYLATRYGLTQVAISGLSPDEEPTPKKISEIANLVRKNNVHYIFFEDLISPRLAETLAQETGAKTLSFNPLEGLTPEEISAGQDYFSMQTKNLQSLKIALGCK